MGFYFYCISTVQQPGRVSHSRTVAAAAASAGPFPRGGVMILALDDFSGLGSVRELYGNFSEWPTSTFPHSMVWMFATAIIPDDRPQGRRSAIAIVHHRCNHRDGC